MLISARQTLSWKSEPVTKAFSPVEVDFLNENIFSRVTIASSGAAIRLALGQVVFNSASASGPVNV
jgi:hypothetical protein